MTPEMEQHLRDRYADIQADKGRAFHKKALDGWAEAMKSVAAYLNAIRDPTHDEVRYDKSHGGDILSWGPPNPWRAGVFIADQFDGGPLAWYWRLPGAGHEAHPPMCPTPAEAVIQVVTAYELRDKDTA